MDRRSFVVGSAAAAATLTTGPSFGQAAYPTQPVLLINPFPPGGAADVVGRPFAAAIEPMLKQPVKIETKAGAAGAVGAQFASTAKPDGYTLLLHIVSISGFAEADRINGRQPKFTLDDFIPIARFTTGPVVLYTNDQTPYKSLKELVEDAKKNPDKLIFSSSGIYGALHLPTQLFLQAAGITMKHLPTNGGGPALTALLGNNSQILASSVAAASGQTKGRQGAPARLLRRQAPRLDAGRADHEGARLRHRVLSLGRPVRAEGHAGAGRRQAARRVEKGGRQRPFKQAMANINDEVTYIDQPDFAKFLEADAKRVEGAVRQIGKLQS